jgi:acyl carrier protein
MIHRDDVEALVIAVIAETFSVAASDICQTTTASDVDSWDSLSHTVLMVRLHRRLGIAIPERIAARAQTVGELIEMIRAEIPPGPAS